MASPFAVFRKYQKTMLVVVGILCMFAFLILPPLIDMQSQQATGGNEVVVKTNYGNVREAELSQMLRQRQIVNRFLQEAVLLTVAVMQQENALPASEAQVARMRFSQLQQQGFFQPVSEESVVQTMVLAEKARELGMVLSDRAINDFLRVVTDNKVTSDQFSSLLKRINISEGQVFEALRVELLANRLRQLFVSGLQPAPPAERFAYYKRLKQQATIEAAALPVTNFIGQVPDPDGETLRSFFEEHKYDFTTLRSPEPGFREPPKVALQYFKAVYDELVATIEVSDEDVLEYYEENKEQYRNPAYTQQAGPVVSQPQDESEAADDTSTSGSGEADAETDEPMTDDSTEAEASQAESPAPEPNEEATPTGESAAGEEADGEETSTEPDVDTEEQTSTDEMGSLDGNGTYGQRKSTAYASVFEAVSHGAIELLLTSDGYSELNDSVRSGDRSIRLAQADESEPPMDENSADAPSDESPETNTAEDAVLDDTSGGDAQAPQAEPPSGPKFILPGEYVLPRDINDAPQWEYEPLWSRRDGKTLHERIADQLKRSQVGEKVQDVFKDLSQRVNQYKYQWEDWQDAKLDDPEAPAPEGFDVAAIAGEFEGITAHETGLIARSDVDQSSDLGRAFLPGGTPLLDYAFDSAQLYAPFEAVDFDGNQYLVWKTDEREEKVPTFDEAREQVLAAWKLIQAREPARVEAARLAEKAAESEAPLSEALADESGLEFFEAGPFSWMQEPSFEAQIRGMGLPQITDVENIKYAGDNFMQAVFSRQEGQTGSALNAPQTVAYVFRVKSLDPLEDVLRATFLVDNFQRYAGAAAMDRFEAQREWIDNLMQQAGVDWTRAPDARLQR